MLTACADNTPTGRANRVSVAHRAGTFGPSGFPKPMGPAGPRWWQRIRRHPRPVAVVVLLAAVAAAAGITVIMTTGGAQRPQASALGLGAGGRRLVQCQPGQRQPGQYEPGTIPGAQGRALGLPDNAVGDGARRRIQPGFSVGDAGETSGFAVAHVVALALGLHLACQGHLLAVPGKLVLTAAKGKAVSRPFVLTASGGPVSKYTIKVPAAMAGKVTVSPSRRSPLANGDPTPTVTVISKAAFSTYLTVKPGDLAIHVILKIKA